MTDVLEVPAPPRRADDAPAPTSARARLAAAAGGRKPPTKRTTTAKKTPTTSRNQRASSRGKYSNQIAPVIKTGATALYGSRNPIAARVIVNGTDDWCASLDALAAEDQRVDALLGKVAGWFGKGGAWSGFATETMKIGVGVALASGATPTGSAGMVLSMFAGQAVAIATHQVATQRAGDEALAAGHVDALGNPLVSSADIERHVAQLLAEVAEKSARKNSDEESADTPDENLAPDDAPIVGRATVFSGWAG